MSSDTDTSASSSATEETRRHKSHKKLKKKSEKKHKKQKKEKRSKKKKRSRELELDEMSSVPITITPIARNSAENVAVLDDVFGPALPPHLLQKQQQHHPAQNAVTEERSIVGPILPQQAIPMETQEKLKDEDDDDDNDDDFSYGPMPINLVERGEQHMSEQQIKLEQRALELKLAAIEGNTLTNVDQKLREEWMLELPDVGLKSGLAAISNMKRTFHQGKEKPDFSDRSEWTKTPNSGTDSTTKPGTSKAAIEKLKNNAQTLYERQRDEEQELLAKKFKKKHKREESLVEIHQKKLRKEQKQKEKEMAASGAKPDRRPFSRDVDLKPNKIDKHQTKQIVDKAKILNTKFSSGQTKYL